MFFAHSPQYIFVNSLSGCPGWHWQMETSERKLKSPNYAWLSLDLVEVLCRLAETEHVDEIREILEFPRHHCPELLALSLVQINSDVSLKVCYS